MQKQSRHNRNNQEITEKQVRNTWETSEKLRNKWETSEKWEMDEKLLGNK